MEDQIIVKMTAEMKDELFKLALKENRSLSNYIRNIMAEKIKEGGKEA